MASTAAKHLLPPVSKLTLLTAALLHDVGHGGLNNAVLKATGDPLIKKYGGEAPYEKYHTALGEQLIQKHADTVLKPLPSNAQRATLLQDLATLIGATDMAQHGSVVDELRKAKTSDLSLTKNGSRPLTHQQILLLSKALLKCADIGNVARPFEASKTRAAQLAAEFEALGEFQQARGLEVTPLFRDTSTQLGTMSSGFVTHVALPLFEALEAWMPSAKGIASRVRANELLWKRLQQQEAQQKEAQQARAKGQAQAQQQEQEAEQSDEGTCSSGGSGSE